MDVFVGAEVQFLSPTNRAVLSGFVVQKMRVQDMFDDYDAFEDSYPKGMVFYKIRVYDVVDLNLDRGEYNPPIVCSVPESKIEKVVKEQTTLDPDRKPPSKVDADFSQSSEENRSVSD